MPEPAIRIRGLGKQYQLGAKKRKYSTLRESLVATVCAPWNRFRQLSGQGDAAQRFWALRDVDLDVEPGEVIGIIGHNGAGKSTLLKILSRITEPTTGQVELRGRVGSLLEVGTGFHPELTGRENVFVNGAILGMSRAEVRRKFDEIVEFAGIGDFLDTPVKRYSSGMHVRLAFAVAAHLEPEILVVDEVLAVGDAEFQSRCLGKMGQVAGGGRTILFVSHNMAAVESLCSRACLLEHGRLVATGDVGSIVSRYLDTGCQLSGDIDLSQHTGRTPGCQSVFQRLRMLDHEGEPNPSVRIGGAIDFELELRTAERIAAKKLLLRVIDSRGLTVFTCNSHYSHLSRIEFDGSATVHCTIRNMRLMPGRYQLRLSLRTARQVFDEIRSGIEFEVLPLLADESDESDLASLRSGVMVPELQWSMSADRVLQGSAAS